MNTKSDSFKKILEDRRKSDEEKYNMLNKYLQELIDAEDDVSEKLHPAMLQLIVKDLHDVNNGLSGTSEILYDLMEDRNKIAGWINAEIKEKESLIKIIDLIEEKFDYYDEIIKKNKDKFDEIDTIKEQQNDVTELRDQLLNYQKKIQERNEELKIEERKDFPYG